MATLATLDYPHVRGAATVRVIDSETGAVKQEVDGLNLTMGSMWDGLFFRSTADTIYFPGSRFLFQPRTYISTQNWKPTPYETSVGGVLGTGTNHPDGWYLRGAEEGTGWPYIEIHNLFQVTGVERTFYSIGLIGTITIPTNDYGASGTTLSNHLTRLLLPEPITQGVSDQLDIRYRLYFEEAAGSQTNPVFWAWALDWAFTQGSETTSYQSDWRTNGVVLSSGGVGWEYIRSSYTQPGQRDDSTNNHGSLALNIAATDFGTTRTDYSGRSFDGDLWRWGTAWSTNRSYGHGILFNEWWPRSFDSRAYYPAWLGPDQGWGSTGLTWTGWHYHTPPFYASATGEAGPFHNSFNHAANSMKLVYNVNALPRTTWRAVFGGSWPATDRLPLFMRAWWSEGGALDGSTAKYKLAFARTLSTRRGYAYDEVEATWGGGAVEGFQADNSTTYAARRWPGGGIWQRATDLIYGHTEYKNSRFGNLGYYNGCGWSSDTGTTAFNGTSDRATYFDMKKYPGLTMNTWWGYQSGKNGKASHLGVEWRRLYPLQRVVWQAADIGPNLTQIDWMEPCNGIPGELDEEMALVVDSTSGIYLLNATQNTATQLTSETGFFRCSYSRDPATGDPIYVALRLDGSSVGIRTNRGGLDFQGTDDQTWGALGGGVLHAYVDPYDLPDRSPYNLATASMGTTRVFARKRHYGQFRNTLGEFFTSAWLEIGQGSPALTLAGDLTIECWAYQTSRTNNVTLFELGSYTNGILFRPQLNSDGIYTSGTNRYRLYSDTTTDINTWIHWAVTRSGSTVRVFKNGTQLTSWTDGNTWNPAGNRLFIGGRYTSGGEQFSGYVSDFRITAAARYTSNFTPPTDHHPWGADGAVNDPYWADVRVLLPMHARDFGTITGGSGYADGTWPISLTGGNGSGGAAEAVVSGGSVVELKLTDGGSGYRYGDTLTSTLSPASNPAYGEILALDTGALVGGSGYADGTYPGVLLSGGTGTGASADVTVSGGSVSAVTLTSGGTGYTAGDTLSAADADLGALGTGAGFAVDALTVDEAATFATTPWSVEVQTLRVVEPYWWSDGQKNGLVMLKPHYRFPHIFVGIMAETSNYRYFPCQLNTRTGSAGVQAAQNWWNTSYAYEGEFFGDAGEGSTGITKTLVTSMRLDNWRNVLWPDMLTFEPQGLCAWVPGLYAQGLSSCRRGWIIYTADSNFGGASYDDRWGKVPWAAPHGYTGIPNAAGGPTHSTYGEIRTWNQQRAAEHRCNMDCPYVIKGVDNEGNSFAWRQSCQPMTRFGTKAPDSDNSHGFGDYRHPTGSAAMASVYDMVSNGRYLENGVEPYKGLIINGGIMGWVSNLFCQRTHVSTTGYQGYPSSWPIDPLNDTVILNPMRWDVFGWDAANSQWVREEWAYDYDTLTWSVDPATVFPGRPAPAGGGTHTLPGIAQYPYSGLEITFTDVRPENSVAPTIGEWSGQYAYNGCVMDGVTEFRFSSHLSARPMKLGAVSQTIPASGVIKLPESYSARFQRLEPYDMNLHDLKIDGVQAAINTSNGFATPSAGQVAFGNLSHLVFNAADVGKTITGTYTFLEYAEQDDPLQWARFRIGREAIVQGSSNDLLGGSAYKASATLISEGWTLQASGNPSTSHVINASAFSAYLPNGFPGRPALSSAFQVGASAETYAERIAFIQDSIGVHWCNASTTPSNSDFGNPSTTSGAPTYGSLQLLHHTSHGITDIHWRAYTDGAAKSWLIFRVQWWFSSTGNPIVAELWYDLDNPWRQEWRQGVWTASNSDYSGTRYHGIVNRTNGASGYYQTGTWPDGTPGQYGSTSNVNTFHLFGGGPDQLAYQRFTLNFDPYDLLI